MSKITFFAPDTDAFADSVVKHIQEYEQASGDTVRLRIIGNDEYFSNQIQGYLSEEDGADVFMSGPVLIWEHVNAGFIEHLDAYVQASNADFNFSDFIPNLINANRWSGTFGDPIGQGPLLSLPVNCESYNLAYHKEAFSELGLRIPTTWDEYFETARLLQQKMPALQGFAQRGTSAWHTMYTGFATQYWSMGGRDFVDGTCAIASPEAIAMTGAFLQALREAGPLQWTEQRWYELALDFGAGKYGLIVDSDHYVGIFENPKLSPLAGHIGYAPTPTNAQGVSTPNLWTWSLVMNARSKEKDASWRFMQWASSKEFLLRAAFEGNMNPTRTSIWDDASFKEFAGNWGDYYEVSRNLAERVGKVLVTPHEKYRIMAERWVDAIRTAYAGADLTEALRNAANDIDHMISK